MFQQHAYLNASVPSVHVRLTAYIGFVMVPIVPFAVSDCYGQAISYDTIVLTDDVAPGSEVDTAFDQFFNVVINDAGNLAFQATVYGSGIDSQNNGGLYLQTGFTIREVARQGQPTTDADLTFAGFTRPVLNDQGEIAFRASLRGSGVTSRNDIGIFSTSASEIHSVAREGDEAPETLPGVVFRDLTQEELVFNNAGHTAFPAILRGTGVTTVNDIGIYSESASGLTLLARKDVPAPVSEQLVDFRFLFGQPLLNHNGTGVFQAILTGNGVGLNNDSGIFAFENGTVSLTAREGVPITFPNQGDALGNASSPVINSTGQIGFLALQEDNGLSASRGGQSLFSVANGTLQLVAGVDRLAPDTGPDIRFHKIDAAVLGEAGSFAFFADLIGPGLSLRNDSGLFTASNGVVSLLAREGSQVPGTLPGVEFNGFSPLTLNSLDQVAFSASLRGTRINSENDTALFATDQTGALRLVVREGQLFDVAPNPLVSDLRTISSIRHTSGSGGGDGLARSFNDSGQLAFTLEFEDGTSGVFVAVIGVPEPSTLALLVLGAVVFFLSPATMKL